MITILLLVWILFIGIETWRNYYLIEVKQSRPIYLMSFVLRAMAAILHGVLFDPQIWKDYMPVFVFQLTSFWILFDLSLNFLRHKGPLYYGKDSGWIDRLFTWIGSENLYFFWKVLAGIVCLFSIIIIYKR